MSPSDRRLLTSFWRFSTLEPVLFSRLNAAIKRKEG